jgi:misacylated tRNA(Ala) deacylase
MTEKLFLDDAGLREMQAVVLSADPAGIRLDRTVFYARSGGQPGDRGVLRWEGGETEITEAIKGDGETVLHVPAPGTALPPEGAAVTGAIDFALRHRLMRMHTTLHLLCAALPGVSVTGGQIGADKSRLDFDMAEPPAKDTLEAALNALIAGNHAVSHEWVDESLLDTNPTLARTLSVKPPRGTGRLRLVRIGAGETPVDLQPCGGTHVATTSEIGAVRIVKIENKGRQNRRIVVELAQ